MWLNIAAAQGNLNSKNKRDTIQSDMTEKELMNDPNLLRRIKYLTKTYDNIDLGKDFDKAIFDFLSSHFCSFINLRTLIPSLSLIPNMIFSSNSL